MTRIAAVLAGLLAATAAAAGEIPPAERRSGFDFMTPETRAMQQDDLANPGTLWVRQGERLWGTAPAAGKPACGECHGDAQGMRGVAPRYPAFDAARGRPIDLAQRINDCRADRQEQRPLAAESSDLLALTTYVATQSRGLPLAASDDPRLAPFRENGRRLFEQRIGQLNFSCANCHDDNWGKRLAGNVIPQGHPNGYPIYRLEWQSIGSLQRRLRNCMAGVRAEAFSYGAPELVDLELYLNARAAGLPIETPAVRP